VPIITFVGLMSRWRTPRSWAKATAWQTFTYTSSTRNSAASSEGLNLVSRSQSERVSPSTSFIVK
jgi:hypothetical protein